MRPQSSTSAEQGESSASEAEEIMQEDNYSTQAVRGSPISDSQSPPNRRQPPSPPLGQAGPSNAPNHNQQSYPSTHHPGTDFLLFSSYCNSSPSSISHDSPGPSSHSSNIHSRSENENEAYETSNPSSQILVPPAAPTPPPNDYGYIAQPQPQLSSYGYGYENRGRILTPIQTSTSPPLQRWTQDRGGAWSPVARMSAEERREMLTDDIPDLDLNLQRDDKMKRDLRDLSELEEGGMEEGRKKRRLRRRKGVDSMKDGKGSSRGSGRDGDRDGGGRGSGEGNGRAGRAVRS